MSPTDEDLKKLEMSAAVKEHYLKTASPCGAPLVPESKSPFTLYDPEGQAVSKRPYSREELLKCMEEDPMYKDA